MSILLLYCYPHYGIIDNNFDLLKKIYAKYSLNEFVVAIPSSSILLALSRNSSLQHQLFELNTTLLVCFLGSFWIKISFARFSLVRKYLFFTIKILSIEKCITRMLIRLRLKNLTGFFRKLTLISVLPRNSSDIFVSDITQYEKEDVREFFDCLSVDSIISIPHGVSLPVHVDSPYQNVSFKRRIFWTVYIHTHIWSILFQKKYYLNASSIIVSGIPKHWSLGPPQYSSMSKDPPFLFVLCSRPYTKNHYLLKSQKKTYLSEIKQLVLNEGHSLIIKLHPGESDLDIFTDSLGPPSLNNNWSITNHSSSDIAVNADICILFYSGTCVDFVVKGIPCIERSNLEECPASTPSAFFKGQSNQLISPYVHYGLAAHAYSNSSFAELIATCISDTQRLSKSQYLAYQTCFSTPTA